MRPPTVGEKIRAARKYRGVTGSVLARKIGVSQGAITYWEQGRNNCKLERLVQIAQVLQVPLSYFTDPTTLPGAIGRQYPGTWKQGRFTQ